MIILPLIYCISCLYILFNYVLSVHCYFCEMSTMKSLSTSNKQTDVYHVTKRLLLWQCFNVLRILSLNHIIHTYHIITPSLPAVVACVVVFQRQRPGWLWEILLHVQDQNRVSCGSTLRGKVCSSVTDSAGAHCCRVSLKIYIYSLWLDGFVIKQSVRWNDWLISHPHQTQHFSGNRKS